MGAGISPQRRQRIIYRMLKNIQQELEAAGVACEYQRGTRSCYSALHNSGPKHAWKIGVATLGPASNGETCIYPRILDVRADHVFEFGESRQGIASIIAHYGTPVPQDGRPCAEHARSGTHFDCPACCRNIPKPSNPSQPANALQTASQSPSRPLHEGMHPPEEQPDPFDLAD